MSETPKEQGKKLLKEWTEIHRNNPKRPALRDAGISCNTIYKGKIQDKKACIDGANEEYGKT